MEKDHVVGTFSNVMEKKRFSEIPDMNFDRTVTFIKHSYNVIRALLERWRKKGFLNIVENLWNIKWGRYEMQNNCFIAVI